jgi:hypothetical protein
VKALAAPVSVAAWLLAAPAWAAGGEDEVRGRAVLHVRFTERLNRPGLEVLFDPATRSFAALDYLRPGPEESYPSAFASMGLEGSIFEGRLRFTLTVDSGEVRRQQFPGTVLACYSSSSPTGLDLAGSGRCSSPLRLAELPSTLHEPGELTSNGRPFGDEVRQTLLLREAYLALAMGRAGFASLRLGRKRITVGDGFIYDDYALGIEADLDVGAIGPQWDLGAAVFYPTRDFPQDALRSPMAYLRFDYLPSLFEHAGLFAAFAHDETGSVPELFRSSVLESDVVRLQGTAQGSPAHADASLRLAATLARRLSGTSNLAWLGTSGHLILGEGHHASWTGALLLGRASLLLPQARGQPSIAVDDSVFGQLAWLRYRKEVAQGLFLGGFFLLLSGDLPPSEKNRLGLSRHYGGFLGIAPYVTATNLFFSGGISESFASRQATAPGVNARGVIAPGLAASWDPHPSLLADLKAAWLLAEEAGPYGGRVYGPEVDLNLTFSPLKWLALSAEADVLWLGDFFPERRPVVKLVLGVDLVGM